MPPKRGDSERASSDNKRARTASTTTASKSSVKAMPAVKSKPAAKKASPSVKKTSSTKASSTKKEPVKAAAKSSSTKKESSKTSTKSSSTDKPVSKKRKASDEVPDAKRAKTAASVKSDTSTSPAARPKAVPKTSVVKALPILTHAPTQRLTVFACGDGSSGELGMGPTARNVKRPRLNAFLDPEKVGVIELFAGGMHAVALTHDNKIMTWGVNDEGSLGRVTPKMTELPAPAKDADSDSDSDDEGSMNPYETTPTAIPSEDLPADTVFTQVGAGDSASFALTNTGLVYGWGTFRDSNGHFGFTHDENNKLIMNARKPMLIQGVKNIVKISVGLDYVLALDTKGDVHAWGAGQQDQLGRRLIDRRKYDSLKPSRVPLPRSKKAVAIFAGSNNAFAVDSEGNTWAWGLNNFCQTGIDAGAGEDAGSITAPTKVAALAGLDIKMIASGTHHTVACTKTGETYVWGRVDGCQMGMDVSDLPEDFLRRDSREKPRILTKPTKLPFLSAHVTASSEHCIAITPEGKAYSWGFNATYVCGQGEMDEVKVATIIDNTAIRDQKLVWAGTGGQFTLFASNAEGPALTNGDSGH